MVNLIKKVNKTLNSIIINFSLAGLILFVFGVLIMVDSSTFVLRLMVSAVIIVTAFSFLGVACRIWQVKKEIDKHNLMK